MPRCRSPRTLVTLAAGCMLASFSLPSLAFEAQVESETTAHGYQLRNAWGDPVLSRRRHLQTLGLHITGIGSEQNDDSPADGPSVSFHIRMRLDADFGVRTSELSYENNPSGFVPGLTRGPFDLMYGYFEARNLADGMLSWRAGRQYVIDPLGWWSFDGLLVRMELPIFVAIEAYGGLEQRAGLPLSTGRFERDGVWRGDRTSLDAIAYPEYLEAGIAPTHGFVVESIGLPYVHGRFAYRRVWNTGTVVTNPLPITQPNERISTLESTSGKRISQERIGASADVLLSDFGAFRAGLIHDLLRSQITSWYGMLDGFVGSSVTAGVDVDRVIPTFDGDSIWNWFAAEPTTTVLGRVDVGLTRKLRASAAGGVRWVNVDVQDTASTSTSTATSTSASTGTSTSTMLDVIGRVSVRQELKYGHVGVSALIDRGERGRRDGFDGFGEQVFEDRFLASARVGLYDWRDDQRPERSAVSFGYVLGGGYRVGKETTARIEWEHDVNELVGQRYRVLASLQLLVNR